MSSRKYQNFVSVSFYILFRLGHISPSPPLKKEQAEENTLLSRLLWSVTTYIISLSLFLVFYRSFFLSSSGGLVGLLISPPHDLSWRKRNKTQKKKTNTTGRPAGDRQTTTRFVAVHIFFHFIRKGPCSRESKNPPTPRSYLFVQPIQLKQLFSKSPLRPPMIKSCTKGPRPCASLWTMIFCWTAIHLAIIDNCSRASASAVTLTRSRGDSQFEQAPCATHPLHNTHPLRFYTITIKERRKVLLNSLDNNHQYSNTRRNMTQPIEVCYYYSFFFSFLFPFLGFYYRRRRDYSQSFPPKPKSYAILFLLVFKPNLNPKRFESLLGAWFLPSPLSCDLTRYAIDSPFSKRERTSEWGGFWAASLCT